MFPALNDLYFCNEFQEQNPERTSESCQIRRISVTNYVFKEHSKANYMYEFDPIFFIFIDNSSTTLIVYRNYRQVAMLTCRESCDSQGTLAKTSNREKKKKV